MLQLPARHHHNYSAFSFSSFLSTSFLLVIKDHHCHPHHHHQLHQNSSSPTVCHQRSPSSSSSSSSPALSSSSTSSSSSLSSTSWWQWVWWHLRSCLLRPLIAFLCRSSSSRSSRHLITIMIIFMMIFMASSRHLITIVFMIIITFMAGVFAPSDHSNLHDDCYGLGLRSLPPLDPSACRVWLRSGEVAWRLRSYRGIRLSVYTGFNTFAENLVQSAD